MFINFCLDMFRASLCPSSGEQRPCVTAYDVLRWFCWMWLVAVVGRCVVGCEHCSHPTIQRPTTATNHIQQNQRSTPYGRSKYNLHKQNATLSGRETLHTVLSSEFSVNYHVESKCSIWFMKTVLIPCISNVYSCVHMKVQLRATNWKRRRKHLPFLTLRYHRNTIWMI